MQNAEFSCETLTPEVVMIRGFCRLQPPELRARDLCRVLILELMVTKVLSLS